MAQYERKVLPDEYFERSHRIMDMEKEGLITPEVSSRVRLRMGIMYAMRKVRRKS